MTHFVSPRRARQPRGVSLVELMVAMAGVSVIVTTTAMVIHGAMRAQSESRRFFDDERSSARLARAFRSDVHAARSVGPLAEGVLVSLGMPDGRSVDYARPAGAPRIERRERMADGTPTGAREDFQFGAPFAASVAVSGSAVHLSVGPTDSPDGAFPTRQKPPAVSAEATLGRDLRFAFPEGGEEER